VDPFLTTLSVLVDDLCTTALPPEPPPGPQAALRRSAVVTWALGGPGQGLGRARGVYRSAPRQRRAALPSRPAREQSQRQVRRPHAALVAFLLPLVPLWAAQGWADAARDRAGGPPRAAQRRGAGGLPGQADLGWRNRRGWAAGGPLLLAVTPVGVSTGLGCGAASPKEPPRAATGFALRRSPPPGLARVGGPARRP
jgi:hypothetical protein